MIYYMNMFNCENIMLYVYLVDIVSAGYNPHEYIYLITKCHAITCSGGQNFS